MSKLERFITSLLSEHQSANESASLNSGEERPTFQELHEVLSTHSDPKIVFLVGCFILKHHTNELLDGGRISSVLSLIPGMSFLTGGVRVGKIDKSVNNKSPPSSQFVHSGLEALKGKVMSSFGLDVLQTIYEASLDINQIEFATEALDILRLNPNGESSSRFKILLGRYFESVLDFDEAIAIYQEIMEEKPFHKEAMKRIVAISKSLGSLEKGIKWLTYYVSIHPSDVDARMELIDLYTNANQFLSASTSAEDLILLQPNNWTFNLKYADTLFRNNQFDLARKYYAKSFNLNENLRSAIGILTCMRYIGSPSDKDQKLKQLLELYIVDLYAGKKSPMAELIKDYFTSS